MIEQDLQYCPRCRDEYRPEITRCAACAIPLISGAELLALDGAHHTSRAARKGALTPDDELVVIQQGSLADLKPLRDLLEGERIGVLISGDQQACGKGCCGPKLHLQVRREDAADALGLLAAEHRRTTGLAGHEASFADAVFEAGDGETVCPACGFVFAADLPACPDCGIFLG